MRKHNAQELKESLTIEEIRVILLELGAEHVPTEVNSRGELITNTVCHNSSGGSQKLYYFENSHQFHCYTGCSCTFDIYELVRRVYALRNIELHFSSLISWVAEKSGRNVRFGFGAEFVIPEAPRVNEELEWMSKFKRVKVELPPLKTYSDRILNVFSPHMNHPEFTSDGITPEAMDTFDVRYYNKDNSLIIPHRNINGDLVGIMARALNQESIDRGYKYLPVEVQGVLYNHVKSQNIYGLDKNIETIKRLRKVAVFESEKAVMQVESMYGRENNFSIALSGKNISSKQMEIILGLELEEIILCLDKEYDDHKSPQAEKFTQFIVERGRKFSPYLRVFTTWDTEGLLDRNESPSDRGKEVLEQLMHSKREILNKE